MGISSQESITSSCDENQTTGSRDLSKRDLSSYQDEVESLRSAKKQAEIKLQLLRRRYEDEASLFSETRVNHILKINGVREYLEGLKERIRLKDDIIRGLKEDLDYKNKELTNLRDRCREAESRSKEYMKAWKDAQMARDRLEAEKKTSPATKETSSIPNRSTVNMSSASSFVENQVPPPPPIDVPSIDEMLRASPSPRGPINPFTILDASVPPPPDIEVPLDELTQPVGKQEARAFVQERGQFLCHVFASVAPESSEDVLSDVVELVDAERDRSSSGAFQNWRVDLPRPDEARNEISAPVHRFHITLIRGHRAIYYHQISQLLSYIETECNSYRPFRLCLDKLSLFNNPERTKQFLCLATRDNSIQSSSDLTSYLELKKKLRNLVDQFATRLTNEDETEDTIAHCSLMHREMQQAQSEEGINSDLKAIETLCEDNLDDYPMCLVNVDKIHVLIGNRTYEYSLSG